MSSWEVLIPIPDELQASPDLVEPNPFKMVWNRNRGGMVETTEREIYRGTWNPTAQTFQDIVGLISAKFPGGSSTVKKAKKGMGSEITAEITGVTDWAGRGMANIDYYIFFKKQDDGKLYIQIIGRNKNEIEEILRSYIQQKLEKAKARQYGRNLRAFTSPTLRKTLNTLPNTATSQLVGFLTGNTSKMPNEKLSELKAAAAKPYEGGKRKSRRQSTRKQTKRRKQTRKN